MLQAYLRDSPAVLGEVLDWVERHLRGRPLVIRLRGSLLGPRGGGGAPARRWPPVFESKAECDRNFEALAQRLLEARPLVRVALRCTTCARSRTRSRPTGPSAATTATQLQVLRLGDELAEALAREGFPRAQLLPGG